MKTIGEEHPKQNDDLSVLELVHREREAELRSFDCMIHSEKDFILAADAARAAGPWMVGSSKCLQLSGRE